MKKNILIVAILYLFVASTINAQDPILWRIGDSDNSSAEFALSDGGYEKFLEHDFGWEDQFFLVGTSQIKENFPFVLPGAFDYWGGGTSG